MANLALKLRIKYGLEDEPSDYQIREWATKTEELIRRDYSRDDAGSQAAREVFPGFGTMILKAEADTLEALLEEAKKK